MTREEIIESKNDLIGANLCGANLCDGAADALHAMELAETDVQQAQAKLRAVADKLFVCHFQSGSGGLDNLALINELRELSAVQ
jgi:ribosomal protein L29